MEVLNKAIKFYSDDPMLMKLNEYCETKYMSYSERRCIVAFLLRKYSSFIYAEKLWIELKMQGYQISISSVYISLNILVEAGVAIQERGGRQTYFAVHPDYALTSDGDNP